MDPFGNSVVATVSGVGLAYDGIGSPSGGIIENIVVSVGGVVQGTISTSIAVSQMRPIVEAEIVGSDSSAIEDYLLGFDWTYHGTSAPDITPSTVGDSVVFNPRGNDVFNVNGGNDNIFAGDGNDTINGGAGNDTLRGGAGGDDIRGAAGADLIYGENGWDRIWGGGGNDTINGGAGNDTLRGGAGGDRISGATGADVIYGENGWDRIWGGGGSDTLFGGTGNDRIDGGSGRDIIDGGQGNDTLTGGAGNDVFVFSGTFGNDVITDFNSSNGAEQIDLSGVAAITNWADLSANHMSQVGNDVLIDDLAGNTIRLSGVTLASLDAGDFLF